MPGRATPANFAELEPGDALDRLVDDAMGDWHPVMAPMAKQLQDVIDSAVASGETAEQLLQRLPQLLAELDTAALTDSLARTTYAARAGAAAGLENA